MPWRSRDGAEECVTEPRGQGVVANDLPAPAQDIGGCSSRACGYLRRVYQPVVQFHPVAVVTLYLVVVAEELYRAKRLGRHLAGIGLFLVA